MMNTPVVHLYKVRNKRTWYINMLFLPWEALDILVTGKHVSQ